MRTCAPRAIRCRRIRSGLIYPSKKLPTFYGTWDPIRNHGHLNLGLSADTSQFACESFRWFWKRIGRHHYPDPTRVLWLCDAGGSNHCRHTIFKQDLQELANELGIDIRVAHYPTYCSKYNPIERRFFSQVTRACEGVMFDCLVAEVVFF